MQELSEGECIKPHARHVERDALAWKMLKIDGDEITFQAGTEVFVCHKEGMIYREWEKEAKRRAAGGKMVEPMPGVVIIRATEPYLSLSRRENQRHMLRCCD
jgi:hypothetical protein